MKYEVERVRGVWMRTYGAHLLGLPDLAVQAEGHHEGTRYFNSFENIFGYLQKSQAKLAPGHTMQLGDDHLRVREPIEDEYFLKSDGEVLVIENA